MIYHLKSNPFFEARIYIGSRYGYNGESFDYEKLRRAVGQYQHEWTEIANPVRITATNFVFDEYDEPGWELAIIDYPRKSRPHKLLRNFAYNLAGYLLQEFKQNRISIVYPDEIIMLEADGAEATNKQEK